jgi:hypothetical protein
MGVLPRLLRSRVRRSQHRRGAVHATKRVAILLLSLGALSAARAELTTGPGLHGAAAALAPLRLAGSGLYRYWGFDVYQASLWVGPGFDAGALAQQRFGLELHYLRAFQGRDIAQRSIDEMRRIGTFSEAQAQRWLQAMQAAFPDVAAGDRLLGVHLPGRGAQFHHNGRPTAEVADPEFAQLFFGIWLSEQTAAPRLRRALLGQTMADRSR